MNEEKVKVDARIKELEDQLNENNRRQQELSRYKLKKHNIESEEKKQYVKDIQEERKRLEKEAVTEVDLKGVCRKCGSKLDIYGDTFREDVMGGETSIILEAICPKCTFEVKHTENLKLKNGISYKIIPRKRSIYNLINKGHPIF